MASVLCNAGRAIITNRIRGAGTEPLNQGWGTGTGTAAASDTTLFAEDSGGSPAYARAAGTSTQQTTAVTNDTYQVVATLTANAGKTITNAGLFDASSGGNLFVHYDFSGVALNANDSITFTTKLQLT